MKKRLFDIFIILTLVVASFIVYSNTFDASFQYDDNVSIVLNEDIQMEEFSLGRLLRSHIPGYPFDRPLAWMSFALNYYFGGLDPFGYHLVNILIHIITGIGVYFLVKVTLTLPSIPSRQGRRGISRTPSPLAGFIPGWVEGRGEGALREASFVAALAALLWLLSPVQIQAVTYIVQRMASMAAMFYVYSFLLYLRGRVIKGKRGKVYISVSVLLFLLALATKQNSLTLPLIIILSEIFLFRHNFTKSRLIYLVVPVFALLTGGFIYLAELRPFSFFETGYAMQERVYTGGRVIVYYLNMMLFPISSRLALLYDFPLSRGLLSPFSTIFALFFIVCAIIILFYRVRRDPLLSFFGLWFFINILPETLYMGIDIIYDHRLYLPSIGFYTVLACSAGRMLKRERRDAFIAIMVMVTLFFSVNTYNRNRVWHDEVSLWSDNIKKAPMLSLPHESLGIAYLKEGKLEEAEDELKTARVLDPLSLIAASGLGTISYVRGDIEGAFREFEYFADRRRVGPNAFFTSIDRVLYSIGTDLLEKDRPLEAAKMFRLGLNVNPENKMIESALNELKGGPTR